MTLPDLPAIASANLFAGLILSAAIVVLVADWRTALYALVAQYILSAILLTALLPAPLAIVRVISGALATLMLYFTLRRIAVERRAQAAQNGAAQPPPVFIVGLAFRLFALALVIVSNIGIASSMTFLSLPAEILFSGLWLISVGILVAILSHDMLRLGLGILMFTSGFCILETATEASLLLYGLLNLADLLLALVIAHLGVIPIEETDLRRRRGEVR